MRKKNVQRVYNTCLALMFFLAACAPMGAPPKPSGPSASIETKKDIVLVRTSSNDTFNSLAAEYLKDPRLGSLIADVNNVTTLTPGQVLAIPLTPLHPGGLEINGYQTVPILVYHRFSHTQKARMITDRDSFEAQMKYLKENGYHPIRISRLMDFIRLKKQIPQKSVVLTFDDGWRSFYDIAAPILQKYGFPATLFIYTDFIGGAKAVTWDQVQQLKKYGFDIQCHSKTHRNLAQLKKNESFTTYFNSLVEEIAESKKILEKKLNIQCDYLAYPYGKTNNLVVELAKKHGYQAAFTIERGGNPFFADPFMLKRCVIYGDFTINDFRNNLSVFHQEELK